MENYKPNSLKSKEEKKEKKEIKKVISGTAVSKKRGGAQKIADTFLAEDIHSVGSYIFSDVFVPAVKKAVYDIVTNGLDMALNGEGHRRSGSGGYKPSYGSYYSNSNHTKKATTTRMNFAFDDVFYETRGDAEEVLENMFNICEEYGQVSVNDMYDLSDVTGDYTCDKYGWTDLRNAHIERTHDGRYIIRLPRAISLN